MDLSKDFKKLREAYSRLESSIGSLEAKLSGKIEANDFSIHYQSSDGFVLEIDGMNAPLSSCLRIVKDKGYLSMDEYEQLAF